MSRKLAKQAKKFARPFRVDDGEKFRLRDIDPRTRGGLKSEKGRAREVLQRGVALLSEPQEKLYAQDRRAVLLIFQAMWQISTQGGTEPQWRRDGKELFYLGSDSKLMSVEVTLGPTFQAGVPKPLFQANVEPIITSNRYAASADGKRFVLLSPVGQRALSPVTVVLNWTAGLNRK